MAEQFFCFESYLLTERALDELESLRSGKFPDFVRKALKKIPVCTLSSPSKPDILMVQVMDTLANMRKAARACQNYHGTSENPDCKLLSDAADWCETNWGALLPLDDKGLRIHRSSLRAD